MNIRVFFITMLLLPLSVAAQKFTEYDRKVFNEGQILTRADVEFAPEEIRWDPINPIKLYSIHDEGDETIVTFSHSIYSSSSSLLNDLYMRYSNKNKEDYRFLDSNSNFLR